MNIYGRVYVLMCTTNGSVYVGKTTYPIHVRFKDHCTTAKNGSKYPIHRAIRKHGSSKFTVRELARASTDEDLTKLEKEFIAKYRRQGKILYNCTDGGDGGSRGPRPLRTVQKIKLAWERKTEEEKEAYRNRFRDLAIKHGVGKWMKGKKHTPEAIQNMRLAQIGKIMSKESRERISKANTGKVRTKEQRTKQSITNLGMWAHRRDTLGYGRLYSMIIRSE